MAWGRGWAATRAYRGCLPCLPPGLRWGDGLFALLLRRDDLIAQHPVTHLTTVLNMVKDFISQPRTLIVAAVR